MAVIVAQVNGSGDQIVFVKEKTFVVMMVFVMEKIFVQVLCVLKLLMVVEQLLLTVTVFVQWGIESGDQFDQKKVDGTLHHLIVDVLQKLVVVEMVVTYSDCSSFSMILLNPIHLVIMFVNKIDMDMNDDTVVELVVKDYTMVMKKMAYEILMMYDSDE